LLLASYTEPAFDEQNRSRGEREKPENPKEQKPKAKTRKKNKDTPVLPFSC
jgi:hypothetical protein